MCVVDLFQQLTWNDTVVFEIPADVPAGELPTYVIIHTYRCPLPCIPPAASQTFHVNAMCFMAILDLVIPAMLLMQI